MVGRNDYRFMGRGGILRGDGGLGGRGRVELGGQRRAVDEDRVGGRRVGGPGEYRQASQN